MKNLDIQYLKKTTCIKDSSIKELPAVISCNGLLVEDCLFSLCLFSLCGKQMAANEINTSRDGTTNAVQQTLI